MHAMPYCTLCPTATAAAAAAATAAAAVALPGTFYAGFKTHACVTLRRRVRSDKNATKKALIRAGLNASKSNCARKNVYYLGVEEGDARANAYYRCGCGCTFAYLRIEECTI